jgi:choline dehydrogenase-like flavoprotein
MKRCYREVPVRDYVIVGAGSAGCALAARLSENPEVRVTLIEAGSPDAAMEIHIPAAFGKLFQYPGRRFESCSGRI